MGPVSRLDCPESSETQQSLALARRNISDPAVSSQDALRPDGNPSESRSPTSQDEDNEVPDNDAAAHDSLADPPNSQPVKVKVLISSSLFPNTKGVTLYSVRRPCLAGAGGPMWLPD